jgi:hypothetical protein
MESQNEFGPIENGINAITHCSRSWRVEDEENCFYVACYPGGSYFDGRREGH